MSVKTEARDYVAKNVRDGLRSAQDYVNANMDAQQRASDVAEISTDGVVNKGVIRGDVALTAINLFSANIITKVIAKQYQGLLEQFVLSAITNIAATVAVGLLAKRMPATAAVLMVMRGAFGLPARLAVQAQMEKRIRWESHRIRRMSNVNRLPHRSTRRDKGPRVRQSVMTRHKPA